MTVNFKSTTAAVAILAASIFATDVKAVSLLPPIGGNFSGSFSNVQNATDGSVIQITGNQIAWGTRTSGPDGTGPGSDLVVNPGSFSDDFPSSGEIKFGTFTWRNASSFNTGGEWAADMLLNIDFAEPNLGVFSETISFEVENTTDLVMDTFENERTGSIPDIIRGATLQSGAFDTPIDLGSDRRLTSVFLRPDDCSAATTSAGVTTCNFDNGLWSLREGAESTIGIYGTVESLSQVPPSPVPLPAAGWMLVAGIGGLVALRRRKKA